METDVWPMSFLQSGAKLGCRTKGILTKVLKRHLLVRPLRAFAAWMIWDNAPRCKSGMLMNNYLIHLTLKCKVFESS